MTDIAILVAEEFERRVRSQSRGDLGTQGNYKQEIGLISLVAQSIKKMKIREKIALGFVNLVSEPKTQISLAASNGFFSA